jgi:enamine deaminase RidA (YjgF/YER057c/UK114 family)
MVLTLDLPNPPNPVGAYEAIVIRRGVGMVSGQFPLRDGELIATGRVGAELSLEAAQEAARVAALNVLAQIRKYTADFESLEGLLRLEGYVASANGFYDQPQVLDAASELFVSYLGSKGQHTRTAFSVNQLPLNARIELVVSFACRPNHWHTAID